MSELLVSTEARTGGQTLAEPVLGWRVWTLRGDRRGRGIRMRPIAGRAKPWPALEPARATCARHGRHEVPGIGCTCGLHATRTHDFLHQARSPSVVGTVALWGKVVEHDHGYRAAFAYPQRLMLVCHLCFWRQGAWGAHPEVVVRLRGGRFVPLCREHLELSRRYGYPTSRLMDADRVEGELLSAYAVDLLRLSS